MTFFIRGISLFALLLTVAFPASGQEAKGVGVVTALTGRADLKRPQTPEAPLKLRDNLFVRDVVDTREESLARVLLMGKSSVTVRELSRFEIREETRPDGAQRALIDLAAGKIRVMVARRLMKSGDEVQIRTPNAVVAVRGSDGIIEATTLPDGRPQTSVLVASGVFEVTAPSTRPIAMAETVLSDATSGIWLAQVPGSFTPAPSEVVVVTGPPGLQQVITRFASPNEVNAAIQLFKLPGGVASGTGADKPVPPGLERALQRAAQAEALTTGERPALARARPNLAGATIGQTLFVLTGLTVITPLTPIEAASGGGNGRLCAHGACSQGQGQGSACAPGACAGGQGH